MSPTRQLAAIMFTDIVGYTAVMGKDSHKALELVHQSKKIQKPLVEKYHGKWLKEMGDGILVMFGTALDAVNCAVEIQRASRADFEGDLRIGIHLGDITIENHDVYGDGVNVASRLESIADAGGIYISESIEKAIQGLTSVQAKYLGEVKLKNVAYRVRTYAIQGVGLPVPMVREDKGISGHFWAELQRRGMIRAAISYVVVALLLVLVWSQTKDWGLTLPQWSFNLLLGALGIGFFLALYLAWNYERSPAGFIKTTSQLSWQNPLRANQRKPLTSNLVIGVLFLIIILVYLYPKYVAPSQSQTASTSINDRSIGIIPFKNLSSEADSEYFSDGMMDAILSHLSKVGDLRVISRTSMDQYRGSPKSIPVIADELGVSNILEGSVQRYGDQVRIIVQLIEANEDKHLWSETYTRELNEVFEVQSDIATQIAQALQAELSQREKEIIGKVPTQDQVAYDFYLKGEDYFNRSRRQEDYLFAIQMFSQAVEKDPGYTLAWVGLAKASRNVYHYYISLKHLLLAKQYLDKAIALDPNMMEVQLEEARYYYHCEINYPKALKILERLESNYPNNDGLYMTIGHIYRRMGQYEKAIASQDKAISLSQFDWTGWSSAANTLLILKRYSEAEQYFKTVIELNPSLELTYSNLAELYMITGENDQLESLLSNHSKFAPEIRSNLALFDHNYQKALEIIESSVENVVADQYVFIPKSLQLGLVYYTMGNKEIADINFRQSVQILTDTLKVFENDSRIYSSLGIAYAGLGMKEEAMSSGTKALSIMNFSVDALRGFFIELDMAKILLMIGDYHRAINKLEFLIQQNGHLSVELLKKDPFWDPLREFEAFKTLINHSQYQIIRSDN